MKALQAAPFNLAIDDQVLVNAGSCNNKLGCGIVIDVPSNLKIRAGPAPISAPVETNKLPGQISVSWGRCMESGCHYELEVQEDDEAPRRAILYVNSHVERNINPRKRYTFKVRACNNCGWGEASVPLVVSPCQKP
jgi:hypothetical protein